MTTGVAAVSAGRNHTCALSTTGTVLCWGFGVSGELGDGASMSSSLPVTVPNLLAHVDLTSTARFVTSDLEAGQHTISAHHIGTAPLTTFPTVQQTVLPANTTTLLQTSSERSQFGAPVRLRAFVAHESPSRRRPSGTLTFQAGTTRLGSATLSAVIGTTVDAVAELTVTTLPVGESVLTAIFEGNNNSTTSTSAPLLHVVVPGATLTALVSAVNPIVVGQSATFTAAVSAVAPSSGIPSGTVTFLDGTVVIGTGTLDASGRATFSTTTFAAGARTITAVYDGSTNFLTSTSTG